MDDAPCDLCRGQRALVHCAQHGARLCLPCDVAAHAAALTHLRAPLCDACCATPAEARCGDDMVALCGVCARHGACRRRRPAGTYIGFPEPAELARILSVDAPPPPPLPEEAWIPDTFEYGINNMHKNYCQMFEGANPDIGRSGEITGAAEEEALFANNADQQDYYQAWTNYIGSAGAMEAGAFQESSYLESDQPVDTSSWSESSSSWPELLMQSDASLLQHLTMNNTAYDQLPMMDTNSNNDVIATPSTSDLAKRIMQSDASLLQPPTMNDTDYDQSKVKDTNTNNDVSSEWPWVCFGTNTGLLGGTSSTIDCQHQEALHVVLPEKPYRDLEKRQLAVQRYRHKKDKRRFNKQIMYASRKATADTRKRVKGRFVKASLEQCSYNDNKQQKH